MAGSLGQGGERGKRDVAVCVAGGSMRRMKLLHSSFAFRGLARQQRR